jgi:lipopolysaccharide biosynthesis glycosyltransferase
MNDFIEIALCTDRTAWRGACITMQSVLTCHAATTQILRFHLFHKDITACQFKELECLLARSAVEYTINFYDIDDSQFKAFKSLHGNYMSYARLMVADSVVCDRLIYLDCDLLVLEDIQELWQENLAGHALGAVAGTTIKYSNEHEFYKGLGMEVEAKYFNAGVLLIDSKKWRLGGYKERACEFANKYPDKLVSVDQTILNYLFHNSFRVLQQKWNQYVYPHHHGVDHIQFNGILHFLGVPKPWDAFGQYLHGNYAFYAASLSQTNVTPSPLGLRDVRPACEKFILCHRPYLRALKSRLLSAQAKSG